MRGERISRARGVSVEFADFRDYAQGDDLRHLDWSVLARLDRPTVRTYQDEDDLAAYILLDASASMEFGAPTKFSLARRCAAALGFVGLVGQDAVAYLTLGLPAAPPQRRLRGRAGYSALARQIPAVDAATGTVGLAESLRQFARSAAHRPGLAVCLTDALDPEAPAALRAVAARGHELVVIQILSALETNPEIEGDLRLVDAESGAGIEFTATADAVRQYRQNLAAHCDAVQEAATRSGGRYLLVQSDATITDIVAQDLRRLGVVE